MFPRIAAALIALLVAASCGGDDSASEPEPTDTPEPTESVEPEPDPEPEPEPEVEPEPEPELDPEPEPEPVLSLEIEITKDVRYGEDQGEGYHPALLDVYAPVEAGPWPTVVMFHGGGGQFQNKNALNMQERAEATAARGAVVFVPSTGGPSADPNARDFRILSGDNSGWCATAFAVARAGEYGGDPEELVLTGFSGGANASAVFTLTDETRPAPPCEEPFTGVEPDHVVLWEGDYMLAPWWDDALEANPDFYEGWIWSRLDTGSTTTWHLMTGDPARVGFERIPVGDPFGTGSECDRPLDGEQGLFVAGGTCRFFELRDPSGELRRAADDLGLFDDGWFSIGDFTLLLADRLEAAGIDHTLTVADEPTTHTDLSPAALETYVDLVING